MFASVSLKLEERNHKESAMNKKKQKKEKTDQTDDNEVNEKSREEGREEGEKGKTKKRKLYFRNTLLLPVTMPPFSSFLIGALFRRFQIEKTSSPKCEECSRKKKSLPNHGFRRDFCSTRFSRKSPILSLKFYLDQALPQMFGGLMWPLVNGSRTMALKARSLFTVNSFGAVERVCYPWALFSQYPSSPCNYAFLFT